MAKNNIFRNINKGIDCIVEFEVLPGIIKLFGDLTGDRSSLHTDKAFGRRSMYRRNVVYGMFPVLFIPALKICYANEYKCYFQKISAKFIKPVFANDRLILASKVVGMDVEQDLAESEYVIKNAKTNATLTTGSFTFKYIGDAVNMKCAKPHETAGHRSSMVIGPLAEEDLQLKGISKGDGKDFQFLISKECLYVYYKMLTEGLLPDYRFDFSSWIANCNAANILTSSLFSTFAGMCIPGRYATFMDFTSIFHKPIECDKTYTLRGKVGFKSESTSTLIENISIHNTEDQNTINASATVKVKVNEPPIQMPSIEFIKNNALNLHLKDRVVLITGASRGIGETTAKLFSLYGAKVAINYFQGKEDADRIVKEITDNGGDAFAVQADVSDRQQVKQMISAVCEKYSTVHILVNNAVRDAYPVPFLELMWDDFQKDIDVILKGAFNCCQEVLPLMVENKLGKIINISTIFIDNPPSKQVKYVTSKSGLIGFTRSLAVEFAACNIQVNMVVPSIVETDLSRCVPKMFLEDMKRATPMKRNATPVDVANAVVFLASSLAQFTTGQKIMVSGGNAPFL